MLYVFECGAIVYDESVLTEKDKLKAVAVNELPIAEEKEGFMARIKADKSLDIVYYEYISLPEPEGA